jgi:pyridinium-3,5-biscarboxylic acid mononucleotide sulfurtransferase
MAATTPSAATVHRHGNLVGFRLFTAVQARVRLDESGMGSDAARFRQATYGLPCHGAENAVASRRARQSEERARNARADVDPGRDGRLDEAALQARRGALVRILQDCESVCIGYSGGVDSVFLAKAALDTLGPTRVLAVTGRSASYPAVQHQTALDCVRGLGIPHLEVETHELEDPGYVANAPSRCYHCKDELWGRLGRIAAERGLRTVVDGSNADDAADHRPGARAAREHGVRSPLQEAGLTKSDIRLLSRRASLPTWDQPASPCLASRIAYGLEVTTDRLAQVEHAESALRQEGLREFRVRHHGDVARVEVAPAELPRAADAVARSARRLRSLGFQRVLLDVEGYRRGALNEGLVQLASQ